MFLKTRWLIALLLAAVMTGGLLAGCGGHSADEQASKDAIKDKIKRDQ